MQKFEKLSRAEMKNVLGGDGPVGTDPTQAGDSCFAACDINDQTVGTVSLIHCSDSDVLCQAQYPGSSGGNCCLLT